MNGSVAPSIMEKEVAEQIGHLSEKDPAERQRARKALVKIGPPSIKPLIGLLRNKKTHLRWEAAKTLAEIKDLSAAPALAAALTDDHEEIRWTAAEGLIELGEGAIVPLLEGARSRFDSLWYRQGAHHVLHALERKGLLTDEVKQVLDSLESASPIVTVPWAAQTALDALRARKAVHPARMRSTSSRAL